MNMAHAKKLVKKILGQRVSSALAYLIKAPTMRATLHAINEHSEPWSADEAINFLFSENARAIAPWQYKEELLLLAKEIKSRRPKTVVEIGTAQGGTLFLAACCSHPDALLISIDLPYGKFGGGYPEWKAEYYKSFARDNQRIELIRADSHSESTFQLLKTILNGRRIDYLFIDGDHTYEGVKQDFERYSTLLSADAMVAFHDIVSDKRNNPDHFVSRYWDEIKNQYSTSEFVKDRNQSTLGIGLLRTS